MGAEKLQLEAIRCERRRQIITNKCFDIEFQNEEAGY